MMKTLWYCIWQILRINACQFFPVNKCFFPGINVVCLLQGMVPQTLNCCFCVEMYGTYHLLLALNAHSLLYCFVIDAKLSWYHMLFQHSTICIENQRRNSLYLALLGMLILTIFIILFSSLWHLTR